MRIAAVNARASRDGRSVHQPRFCTRATMAAASNPWYWRIQPRSAAAAYPLSGTPSAGVAQPFCFLRDSHIRSGRDTGFTGMEASGSDDDTGFTGLSGFHLAVQPGDEKSKRDRLTSCRRRFMNPAKSWYCEKPLSARKGAGQVVQVTSWPMIICLLARARCN